MNSFTVFLKSDEDERGRDTHHLFQVRAELVELVDRPDVHSPGVLVHHQVVELWTLLVGQAPLVRELGHYVQTTAWENCISGRNGRGGDELG